MITEQNVRKIIAALEGISVELALANDLRLFELRQKANEAGEIEYRNVDSHLRTITEDARNGQV